MRLFLLCLVIWLLAVLVCAGCACPAPDYRPVPAWLVPGQPAVPTVMAADLACLSDDTYSRLAERDRACWQYARELRALLGSDR